MYHIVIISSSVRINRNSHRAALYFQKYLQEHKGEKGFFLETAHPVKFPDAVESIIGNKIEVPKSVNYLLGKEKLSVKIGADYQQLKDYLLADK